MGFCLMLDVADTCYTLYMNVFMFYIKIVTLHSKRPLLDRRILRSTLLGKIIFKTVINNEYMSVCKNKRTSI